MRFANNVFTRQSIKQFLISFSSINWRANHHVKTIVFFLMFATNKFFQLLITCECLVMKTNFLMITIKQYFSRISQNYIKSLLKWLKFYVNFQFLICVQNLIHFEREIEQIENSHNIITNHNIFNDVENDQLSTFDIIKK